MLNTREEVVAKIKEKFLNATGLSLDYNRLNSDTDALKCLYSPILNGVGCAVGCLMPRSTDFERIEGRSVHSDSVKSIVYQEISENVPIEFIAFLQAMHDSAASLQHFLDRLETAIQIYDSTSDVYTLINEWSREQEEEGIESLSVQA